MEKNIGDDSILGSFDSAVLVSDDQREGFHMNKTFKKYVEDCSVVLFA